MCTVSFIPQKNEGFIFTSNRDEAPGRSSHDLCQVELAGQQIVYPRDSGAGGTWIAISDANRMVCILNGAFQLHKRTPPYRRSRGLMALDYFFYDRPESFFKHYTFKGMEPFTQVIWDKNQLWELRWDGEKIHPKNLSIKENHLWSSATLYDNKAQNMRKEWFADWETRYRNPKKEDVMVFHTTAGRGDDWNGVIMNRFGKVQTVSITQLEQSSQGWKMQFNEILHNRSSQRQLALRDKNQL